MADPERGSGLLANDEGRDHPLHPGLTPLLSLDLGGRGGGEEEREGEGEGKGGEVSE